MTLKFRSTQVSAPSTAPTSNNSGVGYFVRHRRVNRDGGVSLWSEPLEVINAPVTLTPESYSDTTNLLRDEFLISTDNLTYYIIPRSGTQTGAQTVSSITLGSWTVAVNEDTQNSTLTNLNFGTFTSSNNPFKRLYLVNDGGNVGSLTFNFTDSTTDQVAVDYSGLIQVEIEGVFNEFTQSPTTLYNQSFIWQTPPTNLNTLGLVLPSNGFVKLKVTLLNFPTGGQLENSVNLSMQVIENQQVFPLSYDSNWALNTFLYNPNMGFNYPFIEASNSGTTLTLKPFLINLNGVLVGRFQDTSYTLPSAGDYYLAIGNSGNVQIYALGDTQPDNVTTIAYIETVATDPNLDYLYMFIGVKPDTFGYSEDSEFVPYLGAKFVTFNSSNPSILANTNSLDNAIGIALGNKINSAYLNPSITDKILYAKSGFALVETSDSTIVKGDILTVGLGGLAVKSTTGCLVALTDYKDDYVLVDLKPFPTGSTTSLLAAQVTLDDAGFNVISAADMQDFSAQVDSALDKARTTGVSSGGNITIDVGDATFTVLEGEGQIYDETSPTPVYYPITWSTNAGISPLGNGQNWVYVDNTGTIQVTLTEPTTAQIRTRLYLSRLSVTSGIITGLNPFIIPTKQYATRFDKLARTLGITRDKPDVLLPLPSGANLKLKISTGSLYSPASNYPNVLDVDNVTYAEFNTGVSNVFQYRLPSNTSPTGDTTDIQVAYYAPAGVWTLIPGSTTRVGVHYIWRFPGAIGNVRITAGSEYYTTVQNARDALSDIAALATAPSTFKDAFLLGAIIATKAETDLNNATFVYTNKYGNFSGAVATVGGISTLQTAYDNSSDPEILTNSTLGAVTLRRGSTADTDNVLEVQNNAGSVTFSVNGNGQIIGTTATAAPGTNDTKLASTAFVKAAIDLVTLQTAFNNSTSPELITNSTLGAVTLRRGSSNDADNVLEVQNGAGTTNFFVRGNGRVSCKTLIIGTNEISGAVLARTILTSGSGATFTPLSTTKQLLVKVWGATGGGSGVEGATSSIGIGSTGGNGGYAEKLITITVGETFTYTIGAKGVGGATGANNGTAGGTTSFVGTVSGTVQVTGGGGGDAVIASAGGASRQALGGIATGGDLNLSAGRTAFNRWVSNVVYVYPNSGSPLFGGGTVSLTANIDGASSTALGVGGLGGFTTTTSNYAGGDGFAGQIIVYEVP